MVTVTVTPSGQRWVVPKRDGVVVAALEDRREAAVVAGLVDELSEPTLPPCGESRTPA